MMKLFFPSLYKLPAGEEEEKEKKMPKKNVGGRSTSAMTRNLEPEQWRNREEWHLVSRRQQQLL
jgi:hypothetical protein